MIPDNIFNDVIEGIAGKDVITLVDFIKGKSLVSEFKIAEKLNVRVNNVRNMLYKLDAFNLVDSARKKDKKKGWYVYYWTLDMNKLRYLAVKMKKERIESMKSRITKEESGEFFVCPDKHVRMSLENAMENKFRCPECDIPLNREDNNKVITVLKKQIEKLQDEVKSLVELTIKPIVERKLTRKLREKKVAVITRKKSDWKKKTIKKKKIRKKAGIGIKKPVNDKVISNKNTVIRKRVRKVIRKIVRRSV